MQVIAMSQLVIISHNNNLRKFTYVAKKMLQGVSYGICFLGQILKVLFLSINLKALSSAPVQTDISQSLHNITTDLCTPLPKLKYPQ